MCEMGSSAINRRIFFLCTDSKSHPTHLQCVLFIGGIHEHKNVNTTPANEFESRSFVDFLLCDDLNVAEAKLCIVASAIIYCG